MTMKKRLTLALMLLLCAALLCGCSEKKRYDVGASQNGGNQQNQQNLGDLAAKGNDDYDPLAEEDDYLDNSEYWDKELPTESTAAPTTAPTVRSEYAGATPVVIDPIDKPTPTPVPGLTVTYATYDATKLGLSFEGPAGWTTIQADENGFILQNPNTRMDYAATLTLQATKLSADYSTTELKSYVNGMLDTIEKMGFDTYSPSKTANRDLLGKSGVYANYTGTLSDGTKIAGRVHAVCVDKKLYTLHLSAPQAQWNDYKEMVYDHLRSTLAIVK